MPSGASLQQDEEVSMRVFYWIIEMLSGQQRHPTHARKTCKLFSKNFIKSKRSVLMYLPCFCVLPDVTSYAKNNNNHYLKNKYSSSQLVNHGIYSRKLWFRYPPTHAQLGFIAWKSRICRNHKSSNSCNCSQYHHGNSWDSEIVPKHQQQFFYIYL